MIPRILSAIVGFALVSQSLELEFSVAYNFMNETGSMGVFQPWMAARSGRLKLNFKAFDSDGLIFFVGDNNDPSLAGNYMYLKLEWGAAVLVTQVHYFSRINEENKVEERISLGRNLDDGEWHGLNIERKGSYTIFKVDRETATLRLSDEISNLRIASYLYLGGIPKRYLHPKCKETKERFPRFLGCIKDLVYGEGSFITAPRMIAREYLSQREVCLDACQPSNKCMNGGKCQNFFSGYRCDCLGTGFEGEFCNEATPALTLDGLGYVQVESNSVSNDTNIALGFKTRDTKGIIIGIGSPVSYIVAEILGDRVGVSVKLKTGTKETIVMKRGKVNDNIWHFLVIMRRKQEVRVVLDKRFEQSRSLNAIDDNNAISDNVYLGGAWNIDKVFPGFTQSKFCGCITQAYYNGADILSSKSYKGSAKKSGTCAETQCA